MFSTALLLKRSHLGIGAAIAFAAITVVSIFLLTRSRGPSFSTPLSFSIPKRAGPSSIYPDPLRTPGATNPAITQATVGETICNPDWSTRLIRPPASYTTRIKKEQILSWGLSGTTADYEEDHLISLELGGSPTDPRNLWPQFYNPKPGAREKDVVESYLHKEVCEGRLTLKDAQQAIATDWYKVYLQIRR